MRTLLYEVEVPDDAAGGFETLMMQFLDSTDREIVTKWRPRHKDVVEVGIPPGSVVIQPGAFADLPWSHEPRRQVAGLLISAAVHGERDGWDDALRALEEQGHECAEALDTGLGLALAPSLWVNDPENAEVLRDAFTQVFDHPELDLGSRFPMTSRAVDFFRNTDNEVVDTGAATPH